MRAILCEQHGLPDSLIYTDIPEPVLGKGEVLIQVAACAVNFPDVLIIKDMYQFKPPRPFAPGGEASGVDPWPDHQGFGRVPGGVRVLGGEAMSAKAPR